MLTMENLKLWFNAKCDEANFNRLGLMAFVLLIQGCIFVPSTLLILSLNGGSTIEVATLAFLSFGLLVSFLGDLSARFIIPFFMLSGVVQLLIIFSNLIIS
jgi:hypothetical protein